MDAPAKIPEVALSCCQYELVIHTQVGMRVVRKENAKQITKRFKAFELRAAVRKEVVGQGIKTGSGEMNPEIPIMEGSLQDSRDWDADNGQAQDSKQSIRGSRKSCRSQKTKTGTKQQGGCLEAIASPVT
jgi:hypothetical protein